MSTDFREDKKLCPWYPSGVRGLERLPLALTEINREAVLSAIREFDEVGRDAFLAKYGFGPSVSYFLAVDGKHYDSKAVVGAAHGYSRPDQGPLKSTEFSGGDATVSRLLTNLGFEVTTPAARQAVADVAQEFLDSAHEPVHYAELSKTDS